MLTNDQIYAKVINEFPMNAGILREALTYYVNMLNDPETEIKGGLINPDAYRQWSNDLKKRIDQLYSENG